MDFVDLLNDDMFSLSSLSTAIETLPYQQRTIQRLGIFRPVPITTDKPALEMREGQVYLIPTAARGAQNRVSQQPTRTLKAYQVPHYPLDDALYADDVLGVREFGTALGRKTVAALLAEKLQTLRNSHEVTNEYQLLGAVKGTVVDADGASVIYDWFNEFGVVQDIVGFDTAHISGVINQDIKAQCLEVLGLTEQALNGAPFSGVISICGKDFYNYMSLHPQVKEALTTANDHTWVKGLNRRGFRVFDIDWIPYAGSVNGTPFVADDECHFIPLGVPDLFLEWIAPGNFLEAMGRVGQRYYVKTKLRDYNTGIDIHSQHNTLPICTRPKALVKGKLVGGAA